MDRFYCNVVRGIISVLSLLFLINACSSGTQDSRDEIVEPANADAGGVQFKSVGESVQVDGSKSSGTGISFHWTFRSRPDGSAALLSDFEASSPSFIADQPGSYVLQLIVMDKANGTSKDFSTVNVALTTMEAVSAATSDVHAGVTDSCQICHNGINATGQPENHIESTDQCVVCHSTGGWLPNIAIDHNEILGTCSTCHNGVRAPGKPQTHIVTTEECNLCHNPGTTFTFAIMPGDTFTALDDEEHPPIGDLMCVDCHNNVVEEGKPDDHIPASDACENCHTTTGWELGVADGSDDDEEENDHPPIGDMMCIDCHNNVIEEGKEDDHIMTTDVCEACHNTMDWEPVVTVDHVEVIGECSSCHNNDIAQGKPADHVPTSSECNVCHGTDAWTPLNSGSGATGGGSGATVDHSGFTSATVCMDCHDGTTATGKPPGHIITSSDCDVCHTTTAW